MPSTTTQSKKTTRQPDKKNHIKNMCELIENMQEIFGWQNRLLNELHRETRKLAAAEKKRSS